MRHVDSGRSAQVYIDGAATPCAQCSTTAGQWTITTRARLYEGEGLLQMLCKTCDKGLQASEALLELWHLYQAANSWPRWAPAELLWQAVLQSQGGGRDHSADTKTSTASLNFLASLLSFAGGGGGGGGGAAAGGAAEAKEEKKEEEPEEEEDDVRLPPPFLCPEVMLTTGVLHVWPEHVDDK